MTLFWHQLKSEQLTFWRSREAAIFVFLFPPLLFVLLASVFGDGTVDGEPTSTCRPCIPRATRPPPHSRP